MSSICSMSLFITFCGAFLSTFCLVPLVLAVAVRTGFIDVPDGRHKKHTQPTPYLGGLAVYCGFLLAYLVTSSVEKEVFIFLAGSTFLLFIGLCDDFTPLKPSEKFLGQCLATACFLYAGFYIKEQFFCNYLNVVVSVVWFLSLINAFNLVDIMDGLATSIALGVAINFLLLALYCNVSTAAFLLVAFIGALSAFFMYNRPTARIYLGDAGSLFIGGFLGVIPFFFRWNSVIAGGYVLPIIILAIPLLEIGTLVLLRTYKKIPFYHASPDHFALYLLGNGWSKKGILVYIFGISMVLGITSFLFVTKRITPLLLGTTGTLFVGWWYWALVPKRLLKPYKSRNCNT